jgi:hypothetical protein
LSIRSSRFVPVHGADTPFDSDKIAGSEEVI